MAQRIYLDHNATTPLREEVVDAMVPLLREGFGNPSSTHFEGARARERVDRARRQVASCVGVSPGEVTFTAGATEANNTVLQALLGPGSHVVTTATEHPSVSEPLELLETRGVRVTRLPVDDQGQLDLSRVAKALADDATLVSIIWANNETGVIQPMAQIAACAQEHGVVLHVDATQALGKSPVDLSLVPAQYLAASAHKLNGPKGVGCLVVRKGSEIPRLLHGGPQERRARGGTENVAGIAGFGVACELAETELAQRMDRYGALRDRLWSGIESKVPGARRNGAPASTLPNTLSVEIAGTAGEILLQALDLEGVAGSAGAACHSGSVSPSHVLTAMGRSPEEARATLRLSVGHGVDESQIDRAVALLAELAPRAREAS